MTFTRRISATFSHSLILLLFCILAYIATSSSTPIVTAPAQLAERDVNSVCGFWYGNDSTLYAFNCASHTPCVIAAYLTPNYVFCSPDGQQPITEVFAYEKGPVGGCGIGQICCGSSPFGAGTFTYNSGASSLLFCGHTDEIIPIATQTQTGNQYFSINLATASPPASPSTYHSPSPTATSTSTTTQISNSATSASTTTSEPTPTTTSPPDKLNTGAEIGGIVGGIFAVLGVAATVWYGHKQLNKGTKKTVKTTTTETVIG